MTLIGDRNGNIANGGTNYGRGINRVLDEKDEEVFKTLKAVRDSGK